MKNQLTWVAFVILLLTATKVSSQCEFEGYNFGGSYNGHVYYVSAGDHSWVDANAEAISMGGYLAAISDGAENGFVAAIASTWGFDGGEFDNGQWIGLNDIASEGNFVWSNGEPVIYTNWFGGEPNNTEYGDNMGEDWVEINRGEPGGWNDLPGYVDYIESVVEFNDGDCDGFADACDEIFDDADCDGIGDGCDETMDDGDCDGIGDACDDDFDDADCDGMGDACDDDFDDADCDGTGDACDDTFNDADCDGTGDGCDNCPGGDDDGPCDAESFPGFNNIPTDWICHDNGRKVFMCHEGVTICIDQSAVPAHTAHGDFLGPCVGCAGGGFVAPSESEIATNESSESPDISVFPNPGDGDFTIGIQKHNGTVRIYNQSGQLIYLVEGAVNQKLEIYLPDVGVYIVQFTTDKETITKKLMVVRQ